MKHVSITLTGPEQAFVEAQVAEGKYPDAEACIAAVFQASVKVWAQERLEAALVEGLEGEATEWTDADTERLTRLAVAGR